MTKTAIKELSATPHTLIVLNDHFSASRWQAWKLTGKGPVTLRQTPQRIFVKGGGVFHLVVNNLAIAKEEGRTDEPVFEHELQVLEGARVTIGIMCHQHTDIVTVWG